MVALEHSMEHWNIRDCHAKLAWPCSLPFLSAAPRLRGAAIAHTNDNTGNGNGNERNRSRAVVVIVANISLMIIINSNEPEFFPFAI